MSASSTQGQAPLFCNLLQYVKPFVSILPQVQNPKRNTPLQEKLVWTLLAVLIYLVASQVPLFGIRMHGSKDPLGWMRMMMASNRGTLMDLGISPVITSSMLMQIISGVGLITPDYSVKEDKILVDALQKLIALIMTIGQALVQISTGYYGSPQSLGLSYCLILFVQLIIAGVVIILLDELLQKGYGLGNGVNLFIVSNVCERIVWNALSPKVVFTGRGLEFEGCLIALVHLLVVRRNKMAALYEILFRQNLPNLSSFIFTFIAFAAVVYLQTLHIELPIISKKFKGVAGSYSIKLLYTGSMPAIIQGYIISHTSTISRFLFNYYPNNILVRWLGVWENCLNRGPIPVAGLCYYIYPPNSFLDAFSRPIFTLIYLSFMFISVGWLSYSWLESHEDNTETVLKRIASQDMQLKGTRDANAADKLNEYIPVAAVLGGIFTTAITIFCDVASTMGSGNNIFLAVSIVSQYMDLLAKEMSPRMNKVAID